MLRDDDVEAPRRGQEIEDADQLVVESLARWNDMDLIRSTRRPLRRRIEASQAFHDVADELDADRLCVGRGKYVNDTAAKGERAVLINRVLARKASVDEHIDQSLWLDFRAGAKLDRCTEQTVVGAHARE